jgi:hypothetical protein
MSDLPMSLRTAECEGIYQQAKKDGNTTPLELTESLKIFEHWRIINNDFCYCIGYKTSHMLVIKRAGAGKWSDINATERAELDSIKESYLYENYDQIAENCPHRRTVPHLFHLHLLSFKDKREEMLL